MTASALYMLVLTKLSTIVDFWSRYSDHRFFYAKRGLLTAFAFFTFFYMLTSSCLVVSWPAKAACYVSTFSALRGFMTASALCVPLLRLNCPRWLVSGLDSVTSAGLKPKRGFGGLLILNIAYVFALSF